MMMMMNIFLLIGLAVTTKAQNNDPVDTFNTKVVHVHAQRVFRYAFNPMLFQWEHGDFGGINRFSYSYLPALKGLPDMPSWMKYKYSKRHSAGNLTDFVVT